MNTGFDPAAHRAKDKRLKLVGQRKSGYCGHVPQYVYYDQDLLPCSIHPPKLNGSNVPPKPRKDSVLAGAPLSPIHGGGATADDKELLEKLCHTTTKQSNEQGPKQISGFSGHRAGNKFACGSSVNGPRKTDLIPDALEQQLVFPELGKPRPIPRYPVIRGPARQSPLGWDVFLTN